MIRKFFLLSALFVFSTSLLFSQETKPKVPIQTWGIGVEIQTRDIFGGTLAFALNADMHIGLNLGLLFDDIASSSSSGVSTYLTFGPFLKYFISTMRVRSFYPYIKTQFLVSTESIAYKDPFTSTTKRKTETETKVIGFFGSEWFPIPSFGIYGGLRVIEINLDPFAIGFGTGGVTIGVEWFF
ncbi:MAG: hypothetical protein N2517_00110 [Ignavibacteria bacterium]|nr:hypothetical protein [Ignavibacteria bacterium]